MRMPGQRDHREEDGIHDQPEREGVRIHVRRINVATRVANSADTARQPKTAALVNAEAAVPTDGDGALESGGSCEVESAPARGCRITDERK
jgi:hypothetical protein